jgi:Mg2+-importing ATPase
LRRELRFFLRGVEGVTKRNWREASFFSLAVAVGLTPEMSPMIVSVCLSNGALVMSKKKVIVKRLNSVQNFGAMDVLCTDKTDHSRSTA